MKNYSKKTKRKMKKHKKINYRNQRLDKRV